MENEEVDVLVVGAGASAAAFAWSLSEKNIEVLCLEQGTEINPREYPASKQDWEISRQKDFHPDPNVRKHKYDYPINNKESDIIPTMYNGIGGSTIIWSAHFPRLHPSDFKVKTLDKIADDWPINYEYLEPYYNINDKMIGVSGMIGDPAYPPKVQRQTKPLPLGKLGSKLVSGFEKLGWHWWPSDSAIITEPYDGREECNSAGTCDIGCYRRAKASADVTYWPKALMNGVIIKDKCTVREITIKKNGLVDGVIYYDSEGKIQIQKAKIVILACNGVGTPRLLLNSISSLFPNGLANNSGLVGKNLMFHPISVVTGVFDSAIESFKGPPGCSIFSHEFYETDHNRNYLRGFMFQIGRGSGPLTTATGGLGLGKIPWGKNHHNIFKELYGNTMNIGIICEDLPEVNNNVSLDPVLTDKYGIPAPKVKYKLSNNSKKMIDFGNKCAKKLMNASGAKKLFVARHMNGYHLLGTARMGYDPEQSVVDKHGRCHDVKNLFIIDGSIFVTSGAVNPTSTIQALSLSIADYIKINAKNILD